MPDSLKEALLALEMAMQTERDGREFYLKAAAATQHEGGRMLFARIADDELGHLAMLQARKEALLKDGRWLPLTEHLTASVPSTPIFATPPAAGELNAYTSDLSALRIAYLRERDAVEFYTRAADRTDDPEGKKMYRALADMEQAHQDALQTEYKLLSEQFKAAMGFSPF